MYSDSTKAIIFDMDGVLVDSAAAHLQSWRMLGEELGIPVSKEQVAATFGRHNADIIPLLFGPQSKEDLQAKAERKEALYRDLIREQVPVMPGAMRVVQVCREHGYKLAVGSSAPRANIELVLEAMGLAADFACCVGGEDVLHGKPHPEVFLTAAGYLEVLPIYCVVIEDAPAGIEAACSAGMLSIGVCSSHPPAALHEADWVVSTMDELAQRGVPPTD